MKKEDYIYIEIINDQQMKLMNHDHIVIFHLANEVEIDGLRFNNTKEVQDYLEVPNENFELLFPAQ